MRFYRTTRDLHLYFGLFLSPFVLVFALSVIFLVHAWLPGAGGAAPARTVLNVPVPAGLEQLESRARVDAVRGVLNRLGVAGEVGFIRHVPREHRLIVPVSVPGREITVDLDYQSHTAKVAVEDTGLAGAVVYLHKSPGPHLAAIRGNWIMARAWRWFADATVYLVLFISISGIYLWTALRAERTAGLVLIAAGTVSFFGIVYALSH